MMSDEMILLQGTPGFPGIVEGRTWLSREKRVDVGRQRIRENEIETELLKFRDCLMC